MSCFQYHAESPNTTTCTHRILAQSSRESSTCCALMTVPQTIKLFFPQPKHIQLHPNTRMILFDVVSMQVVIHSIPVAHSATGGTYPRPWEDSMDTRGSRNFKAFRLPAGGGEKATCYPTTSIPFDAAHVAKHTV